MLNENQVFNLLSTALIVSDFNINSNVDNTSNWDSLGQLAILTTLSKATNGATDNIKELREVEDARSILKILRENNLLQ